MENFFIWLKRKNKYNGIVIGDLRFFRSHAISCFESFRQWPTLRVHLVGGVEKWEGRKLFYLVGEKNGRMKNVVYIN